MNSLELPALIAAIPVGILALIKAYLLGKQTFNGKLNGYSTFTHADRECLHQIARDGHEGNRFLSDIRDDIKIVLTALSSNGRR